MVISVTVTVNLNHAVSSELAGATLADTASALTHRLWPYATQLLNTAAQCCPAL